MTKTKLLLPRYKVIAGFPDSKFTIGETIEMMAFDIDAKEFYDNKFLLESYYSDYPAIFKKLEWWEERTVDEMPEYLKNKTAIPVTFSKVEKWEFEGKERWITLSGRMPFVALMWAIDPASESEYNDYISKNETTV